MRDISCEENQDPLYLCTRQMKLSARPNHYMLMLSQNMKHVLRRQQVTRLSESIAVVVLDVLGQRHRNPRPKVSMSM